MIGRDFLYSIGIDANEFADGYLYLIDGILHLKATSKIFFSVDGKVKIYSRHWNKIRKVEKDPGVDLMLMLYKSNKSKFHHWVAFPRCIQNYINSKNSQIAGNKSNFFVDNVETIDLSVKWVIVNNTQTIINEYDKAIAELERIACEE